MTDPSELERGLAACAAGLHSQAFEILRPLAEAGNVEAQASVGSLVHLGLHRFTDQAAYAAWSESVTPDEQEAYYKEHAQADREMAMRFLQSASDGGNGYASHNLAMMYIWPIAEGDWSERRKTILGLLAKARQQGFLHFNDGEPAGEAYLQFLERSDALLKRHNAKQQERTK